MSGEIRCINLGYVVPKDNAEEVEKILKNTHYGWKAFIQKKTMDRRTF